MKIKADSVFALFLLMLVMVFIVISFGYPLRAAIGPLAAGIPAAILLISQILLDFRGRATTREGPNDADASGGDYKKHLYATAWIAGLLFGTYFFGILLTFTLFTVAYIKVNGWGWVLSVGMGAGVFILLFGIFGEILQVSLYAGILFQ